MKIAWIAFTEQGVRIGCRLQEAMKNLKKHISGTNHLSAFAKGSFPVNAPVEKVSGSLAEWTRDAFAQQDAILFIGATGIAVRSIAPYLKSKTTDPAVLVMDEQGNHIIPLVSGHIGGANQLATDIAEAVGALPVITTATDLNHRFAVDLWAKKNNLFLDNMKLAKQVSADLLQKKEVGFFCDEPVKIKGGLPRGFVSERRETNVCCSVYQRECCDHTLLLVPKLVTLGLGCRRGTSEEKIRRLVDELLEEQRIHPQAIAAAGTIDLKEGEEGLLEFCSLRNLNLFFYTKEELQQINGDFSSSEFVRRVTGVDNVCERAALAAAAEPGREGDGEVLLVQKRARDGVTAAIAAKSAVYRF